jgi:hypothetical protein
MDREIQGKYKVVFNNDIKATVRVCRVGSEVADIEKPQ